MGDIWLDSQEDILKGARGLTFGRNGSEGEGSARVRERLEAHGGPRDREYNIVVFGEDECNKCRVRLNPRLTCDSYLDPGSLGERGTTFGGECRHSKISLQSLVKVTHQSGMQNLDRTDATAARDAAAAIDADAVRDADAARDADAVRNAAAAIDNPVSRKYVTLSRYLIY